MHSGPVLSDLTKIVVPDGSINVFWFEGLSFGDVASVGARNATRDAMAKQPGKMGLKSLGGFAD